MCGITGFWTPSGLRGDARTHLAAMMARLQHRGPDGSGMHLDPERGLAMGHTRLTIIDLRTGAQPLSAREGKLVASANGELYDYKRQRAELTLDGARFETKSDSELVLYHYLRRGLDFVERLRGEFALVLFDAEKRRLVLVRDRFGIKPLYFRATPEAIYWGSESKALLAHPDVPARLDRKAALHQLMQVMVPGTTAFEGIEALQPGHMLIVEERDGRLVTRAQRYWDLEFPQAGDRDPNPDPKPAIREVRERLVEAVQVRLEADVPVGCYLSGGIDSCSILGLATPLQQSPVKAFTISFDHGAYDESLIAREMAQSVDADQEVLQLEAKDLYGDSYVRTVWHAERTFYNTLGVAKWHMSKRVRECGYKVVVTGEGSDELFGGYPFFKRDLFRHGPEYRDGGAAHDKRLQGSNKVFEGSILAAETASHPAFEALMGFTPAWIQPWILMLERIRPLLGEAMREELGDYDPIEAIAGAIDKTKLDGRHPLDRSQYSWSKTMLEGQILTWGGDRVDMANSMESRPAFLDHHVAEHAVTLAPSLRISPEGVEKWVLREAMKGVLPEVLYKREKFAFMAPPAHTDRRKRVAIEELIDTHMGTEEVAAAGLVDEAALRLFLEGHWKSEDHVTGTRGDIVLNHVLGLHIMQQELVDKSRMELKG